MTYWRLWINPILIALMNYLLDTNIIIIYSRDSDIAEKIEEKYNFFSEQNTLAVSIVTLGELDSLIKQLNLGEKRRKKIELLLEDIAKVGLNSVELIQKYGDIDAFSQGKLKSKQAPFSARNMGKNDLWIAATASTYNLTLVTTDKDFSHLKGTYLDLEIIDIEKFRN